MIGWSILALPKRWQFMANTLSPEQNQLLAAMPTQTQRRIFPQLELVSLPANCALYESGMTRRYVYFPTSSIISLEHVLENGASAGISMVGNEGLVGMASFMGSEFSPWRAVSQSAGAAYRLLGSLIKQEFDREADVLRLMLRYSQSRATQMSQMAVCNRHHSIEQQLCRWLLFSLDRLEGNQLHMTQEHISNILGVRREGVTVAANKLYKLGVIEYSRGEITVLDRAKLESMSCECYVVVKRESDRLLPAIPKQLPVLDWVLSKRPSVVNSYAFAAH